MNWLAKLLIATGIVGLLAACCCFGGLHDTEVEMGPMGIHNEGNGGDV